MTSHDPVNHPAHYTVHASGVECIEIAELLPFCVGNAVKYLWRLGLKDDAIENLRKAEWYLRRHAAGLDSSPFRFHRRKLSEVLRAEPVHSVLSDVLMYLTDENPNTVRDSVAKAADRVRREITERGR